MKWSWMGLNGSLFLALDVAGKNGYGSSLANELTCVCGVAYLCVHLYKLEGQKVAEEKPSSAKTGCVKIHHFPHHAILF